MFSLLRLRVYCRESDLELSVNISALAVYHDSSLYSLVFLHLTEYIANLINVHFL